MGKTIDTKALPPVTHDQAREILGRFNSSHWNNPSERARYSIPADPEHDDDLRLGQYIDQCQAATDRLAALEAENAQLREAVAGKLTDEVVITDILIRNGMSISLEGGACHLLAEVFAKQLADSGVENYIEMSFQSKTYLPGEQLVVTLRRCKGKTPHQFRTEAEQKAETLEADNQQLRGLLSDYYHQHRCGCGHPACRQCGRDKEAFDTLSQPAEPAQREGL